MSEQDSGMAHRTAQMHGSFQAIEKLPEELLEAAIDEVPCAVAKLIPLVDFVARFNADSITPVLDSVVKEFEGCTWPFHGARPAACARVSK